jgi:hypothetical protein
MRKCLGVFVGLMILNTSHARAQGEPTALGYPAPDCVKPDPKLIKPEIEFSNGIYAPDNSRIVRYNRQAKAFDDCMHAYIENSKAAIAQIRDKANSDIKQVSDRANSAIKAAEARLRDAVSEANMVSAEEADAVAKTSAKSSH